MGLETLRNIGNGVSGGWSTRRIPRGHGWSGNGRDNGDEMVQRSLLLMRGGRELIVTYIFGHMLPQKCNLHFLIYLDKCNLHF